MVELARLISNDCFQPLSPRLPRVCTCVPSHFSHIRLCDPMDCSPPGSSVHEILPGKNTGVGCHALLQGGLPDPGTEPLFLRFPASACRFFTTNATWEVQWIVHCHTYKKKVKKTATGQAHTALTMPWHSPSPVSFTAPRDKRRTSRRDHSPLWSVGVKTWNDDES